MVHFHNFPLTIFLWIDPQSLDQYVKVFRNFQAPKYAKNSILLNGQPWPTSESADSSHNWS